MSDVIDKIRKLFAQAKSDNIHEANSAVSAAHKLMLKHKLTEADVERGTPIDIKEISAPGDFSPDWRFALLSAIAFRNFCRTIRIFDPKPTMDGVWDGKVIGTQMDADLVLEIFNYYEKMLHICCEEDGLDILGYDDPETIEFLRGGVNALQEILEKQHKEFEGSDEKALAVIQRSDEGARKYIDERYKDREKMIAQGSVMSAAFFRGYYAAHTIPTPEEKQQSKEEESKA